MVEAGIAPFWCTPLIPFLKIDIVRLIEKSKRYFEATEFERQLQS
jgi:hypothetical protein